MARRGRYELPVRPTLEGLARIVREMRLGRLNVSGEVTVLSGTTATVIADAEIGASTVMTLTPLSEAAAELTWWEDRAARTKGSITIGHAAPSGDLAFSWLALG